MKKSLLVALAAFSFTCASAQVENRCLSLTADGQVDCGVVPELNGITSFTVQMWLKPTVWGGTPFQRGNISVALSGAKNIDVTVGGLTVTADGLGAGQWQQLTVVCSAGQIEVLVDGASKASKGGAEALDLDAALTLGAGYEGLVDEVRVWNTANAGSQYGYFWNNTLNEFNDLVPRLVAYYKMDHEEWTESLVDYKSLWAAGDTNHHGAITGGAFVSANNDKLPYLLNGAYTANERFYDRSIQREAYLMSNDIINLGIVSYTDGHLEYSSPCNHATLCGTAARIDSFGDREGVLSLDGAGYLESPSDCFNNASNYTVEGWIYIDEWVEGATFMRKGAVSGTDGFSITLGDPEAKSIVVSLAGMKYVFKCGSVRSGRVTVDALPLQQWVYLGVSVRAGGTATTALYLSCNGTSVSADATLSTGDGTYAPTGIDGKKAYWGEKFKGYMDQLVVHKQSYTADNMSSHATNTLTALFPGLSKTVTSSNVQNANTLYLFDDAANPGWDSYSQDEWLKIMRSAFDGYRGYSMRISVKSHTGWEKTITSSAAREQFGKDLGRLSEPYDGVELDLEWSYSSQWESFGQLIDEIYKNLPAGKTLMVSLHNVSYQFVPKNRYDKCAGFTVQQYGPQQNHFTWDTFVSKAQAMVSYGLPKEKLYLSYATTTSNSNTGAAIMGIRTDCLTQEGYVPSQDCDTYTNGNGTFYFMSPIQVYRRAQYVTDNRLQGIFYWDMGNDLMDYTHPYHYAKMSTYGLCGNVDRIVTSATPNHPAATGEKADDPDTHKEDDGVFGTRVTALNSTQEIVNGACVALMCAQKGFGGLSWMGGDVYATNEVEEIPTIEALFQLERAEEGYYMRQISTGKYLGQSGASVVLCDSKSDSQVGAYTFTVVTGTGELYQDETANLINVNNVLSTENKLLKEGNASPDYGSAGNGAWKVWRMYTYTADEQEAVRDGSANGIDALLQTVGGRGAVYDLQGRQVSGAGHGLYIIGGKKVVL